MTTTKEWYAVTLTVPKKRGDIVSLLLFELGSTGIWEENGRRNWLRLKAYFNSAKISSKKLQRQIEESLGDETRDVSIATTRMQDWANEWRQNFRPFEIARGIIVKPSWERYKPSGHEIIITLDPGMAFGTGTHATTRLCAQGMTSLLRKIRPQDIKLLDLGTGSGILSLIAAKLGVKEITAIDTDKDAIEASKNNIVINQCNRAINVNKNIKNSNPVFDVVVANILYTTLVSLSGKIARHTKRGGHIFLSGITTCQEAGLLRHYPLPKWRLIKRTRKNGWSCLLLKKL